MADIKTKYATADQEITITLNSLADDAMRQSTAVDNSVHCYLDALVQIIISNTEGAPAGDKNVLVYAYGTADGGNMYSGGAGGTDGAFGTASGELIENCKLLGIIHLDADDENFKGDVMSVSSAFGGVMPQKWGIIVKNQVGVALAAANNYACYQGVYVQTG